MIHIYTDGSCLKNPNGPGGWAFYSTLKQGCGGERSTTNNRMEIIAVIEALKEHTKEVEENKEVKFTIYSDSQYVINCATGKFKRHKNLDLWKEYEDALKGKNVSFVWVRGHDGNEFNEKVDFLARSEARKWEFKK